MTKREEIDMLRRQVADLTERVLALEARPAAPIFTTPPASDPYINPLITPWVQPTPVWCGDSLRPGWSI